MLLKDYTLTLPNPCFQPFYTKGEGNNMLCGFDVITLKAIHVWKWAGDSNQIPDYYTCECGQVEYKDKDKSNDTE